MDKWIAPILVAATLGLAPFFPEPHIWKQLKNIANGTFTQPIDWLDLVMHGAPWGYLFYKIALSFKKEKGK